MARLRAFGRWLDALLALVLTVAGQLEVWSGAVVGGPRPAVAVVTGIGTLALLFRRRAPITVLVVAVGSMSVQGLLGVDSDTGVVALVAAFIAIGSAGLHARRPVLALVVALLLIWPVIVLDNGLSLGDLAYATVLIGLAWSVGRAVAAGTLRAQLAEQRAMVAMAQERVRIARELHDIVAHSISVIALHAGGVRRLLRPDQQEEREALQVVERTARTALAELQHVLDVLRTPEHAPDDGRPGLARADDLMASARAAGLAAQLRIEGAPRPLPAGVDLSMYRILQEAVTNVLKHAGATRVDATISYGCSDIRLDVTDDGAARNGSPTANGHGLIGMRERAELYAGTLDAGPLPGRGYRVAAAVPLPEQIR